MLEFAIGSGMLMAIFSGTFQFGFFFLQYNNLQNAVERGAHYAAVIPYDSASSTPSSAYTTAVANMVVYGSPSGGSTPVVSNLSTSNVQLTVTFANNVPSLVTVSITGYTIDAVFTTRTLTNKPQVAFTYQGIWSPI